MEMSLHGASADKASWTLESGVAQWPLLMGQLVTPALLNIDRV
jgi:hypothetical protein